MLLSLLSTNVFALENITNPSSNPSVNTQALPIAFQDLHSRMPNWWQTYKYTVLKEADGDSFIIRLFSLDTDVVRIWDDYLNAPNVWNLEKTGTTVRYYYYYYMSNGQYVTSTSSTGTLLMNITNKAIYSNVPTYHKINGAFSAYGSMVPIPPNLLPGYVPPTETIDPSEDFMGWMAQQFQQLGDWIIAGFANVMASTGMDELFADLGQGISDTLNAAFIPTQADLENFYSDMDTLFTSKLGFLWYPVDWIISTLNGMINAPVKGTFYLGELFGGDLTIDMTVFEDYLPQYWSWIQTAISAFLAYGVVEVFFRKLKSKLNGGQVE